MAKAKDKNTKFEKPPAALAGKKKKKATKATKKRPVAEEPQPSTLEQPLSSEPGSGKGHGYRFHKGGKPASGEPDTEFVPQERHPVKRNAKGEVVREDGKVSAISVTTYNALMRAYFSTQTITDAARQAGVSKSCARHYIAGPAAPDRGMLPIKQRYLEVQARAQEEEELTLLQFRRKEMAFARKLLTGIHGEIELAIADVHRRLQEYRANPKENPEREMSLVEAVGAYERATRHVEHLLGGPDALIHHGQDGDLDALDEEEAAAFIARGTLPASMRNQGVAGKDIE